MGRSDDVGMITARRSTPLHNGGRCNGWRQQRTDEQLQSQLFGYDGEGRLVDDTDKPGRTVEYDYDDAGRLETTNRDGDVLSRGDDVADRVASATRPRREASNTDTSPDIRPRTMPPQLAAAT